MRVRTMVLSGMGLFMLHTVAMADMPAAQGAAMPAATSGTMAPQQMQSNKAMSDHKKGKKSKSKKAMSNTSAMPATN